MNWNYISGFFDADGSITLANTNQNKFKTIQLSFHNNELNILEEIQEFMFNQIGVVGSISIKPARKETHNDSYDLKYVYLPKTLAILKEMTLLHPKKKHRKNVAFKLINVTPRNGKYILEMIEIRKEIEKEFFTFN
jgi:hypothetical protein